MFQAGRTHVLRVVLAALLPGSAAIAQTIQRDAQIAIGQQNLVYNILNQTGAATLFFPYDVARDTTVANTRFFVADAFNSRVLGIECAGTSCTVPTGASAVRVFGQPDFASWTSDGGVGAAPSATTLSFPRGVAVAPSGALVVADTSNNRVLVYNTPWTDATADVVLGQSSMSAIGAGSGLSQLRAPEGVFVDAGGAVWVADSGNNRVLRFGTVTTGATADLSIGGTGGASASTLSGPRDVLVDGGGRLWVADWGFSRVLEYDAPLSSGMSASRVFGQGGSFTGSGANSGGISATSLAYPEKLEVDGSGRLWVSDTANNRVLEWDSPLSSATASRVYGQTSRLQVPSFTQGTVDAPDGFPNASGLAGPRGIAFDANGTMWVCDRDSSRVLAFDSPLAGGTAPLVADRVLGKSAPVSKSPFVANYANAPTADRVNNPTGVAVDRSVTPNRLWIAEQANNRVMGYASTTALATGIAADKVLGQPDFTSGATNADLNGDLQNAANSNASSTSMFYPTSVAVDSAGGVYVADTSNNRVLRFANPYGTDTTADQVFGQGSFTALNPGFPYGTAQSHAGPQGVHVGPGDTLWVADTAYHRVVGYSNAPAKPATSPTADLVVGQAGFVSSATFPPYTAGCAQNRMNAPDGVFQAAGGRLYVADSGNHRVLVFDPPITSGMNATFVLGQASFTSCSANRGGSASAATLNSPRGVYEDASGNVWVADYSNNRVLMYPTPISSGMSATAVLGQPDLTTTSVVSPGPDTLFSPTAVTGDASGLLYVADTENSRITRYSSTLSVSIDPIPSPIVIGKFNTFTGSGFTAGSRIKLYVATASGPVDTGTFTPNNVAPGYLIWQADPSIPLGNGFGTLQVVNTDQGFIASNYQSQLLYGDETRNMPTILTIGGVGLSAANPSVPTAVSQVVAVQNSTVTITGTGFNGPLVNLFTPTGNSGPLTPLGGGTSTQFQVVIPSGAPTGSASFQVVNSPYTGNVMSNSVTAVLGALVTITSVSQVGSTVTVNGTGFSTTSVINLFNKQGASAVNLGGLNTNGTPKIPLTFVDSTRFTFTPPAGTVAGPAYVQVLNPPYIPFTASGNDPDGAFMITP